MKPNCYDCIYRRDIPGDAHSQCVHPSTGEPQSMIEALALILVGKTNEAAQELNIQGNTHGITHGWFYWPANFDPIWLENCDGYTRKET